MPMCSNAAVSCTKAPRPNCATISTCDARYSGCDDMEKTIAVIGAGLIGRAWAMVFARGGWHVRLTDKDASQLDAAQAFVAVSLEEQASFGLLTNPSEARARIESVPDLEAAAADADWVQENLPETEPIKGEIFAMLDGC